METFIKVVHEKKPCTSHLNYLFEWLMGSLSKRQHYEYRTFNGCVSVKMPFEKKMVEVSS